MTMLEGLSKPMRDTLDAIRAGGNTTFKAKAGTIKALIDRGLIEVTPVDQPQRWQLSPVGEMVYFSDEVMKTYQTSGFKAGEEVQYLHWHTNGLPWRFEWQDATVQRVTKGFVFVKYADGTEKRHLPKRLRRKPLTQREQELDAIIVDGDFHRLEPQQGIPELSDHTLQKIAGVFAVPIIIGYAETPEGKSIPVYGEKPDLTTDTSFEPYIPEPRFVAPGLVAVTAVCNLCGCQYDSIHLATLRNPWLFANQNPRCPACLWPDVEERKRQRDEARLEHDEPLVREPRMVNDKLIAVTGFCKACGGQYDDVSFYEAENPWKRSQFVDYCPICLQFTCMWCGKELPPPAIEPYCDACNAGPMQVHKAEDVLPASVCAEFPLLATFLDGGEGAYHILWTWYMQQISIGLITYEGGDPLQAKLYERSLRSASSLLHLRFEEEYFGLVVEVGTGRPEVDLLYHKLPISVETTVRGWLYTWGGFEYGAQMTDIRPVSREHAVYVDPIKPTLTAQEYREGQYGARQRAGVCRVWWRNRKDPRHLVTHVTFDDQEQRWYAHLLDVNHPVPLYRDEQLVVETLEPVHINDRVRRIDNEQIGTVIGISGGDVWVKPEQGGEQPRWKRIHVDVIRDPQDDPTDEYDRALNEAVLETMGGAHAGAPQPWTPDLLKRARISTGVHAGVIGQVTDIGSNSRGETFKVFGEWYNASDLEDPNTPMLDPEVIARNCAMIRLRLHGGLRVGRIKSVTHVEDQYYRVVFTHFTEYVPDEIYERVRFAYEAAHASDTPELSIFVDLAHPPFWRVRQSDEAREFQALLDAAGIALEARFNAQHELLVYHPLADVLERLCANVRKLAGVLAVDLGFNDNACLALVKRLEGVAVNG